MALCSLINRKDLEVGSWITHYHFIHMSLSIFHFIKLSDHLA